MAAAIRATSLVGAVALVALAGSAASASAAHFYAEEYPASVSAQQEGVHVFTAEAGLSLECATATFTASLPEPLEVVEVLPNYESCTASGLAADVEMEGCKFRLEASSSAAELVCPAGKVVKMVAGLGTCEIQLGSQSGLLNVGYANLATSPATLRVEAAIVGFEYTKTKDGAFCPLMGLGTKADGQYAGIAVAKAFTEAQVGLFQGNPAATKLCKVAGVNRVCPAGNAWPKDTELLGASGNAEISVPGFGFIQCSGSTIEGKTSAAEGTPRLPTSLSKLSFTGCFLKEKSCGVGFDLKGAKPEILSLGNGKWGDWQLGDLKLIFECKTTQGLEFCQYGAPAKVKIIGDSGKKATAVASREFTFEKGGGGMFFCPQPTVTWTGDYALSKPEDVFVTN